MPNYVLQFISKYKAKLRRDNAALRAEWTNLQVETLAPKKIRLSTSLRSGNSVVMVLEFSSDLEQLYSEFKFSGSRTTVFSVEGSRIH